MVVVVDTYRSHDQYDYYYNDYYYYYNGLVGCVLSWVGRGRLGRPHTPPIHRRPKMTLFLGGEKDKSVRGGKPLPKWNNWVPTYLSIYLPRTRDHRVPTRRQYLARSCGVLSLDPNGAAARYHRLDPLDDSETVSERVSLVLARALRFRFVPTPTDTPTHRHNQSVHIVD